MKDLMGREMKIGGRCGYHGYVAVGDIKKLGDKTVTVDLVRHSEYGLRNGEAPDLTADGITTVVQRPERAVVVR